jgi:signal transduction histidine kinase/ActR/RegA family two-component response regulator
MANKRFEQFHASPYFHWMHIGGATACVGFATSIAALVCGIAGMAQTLWLSLLIVGLVAFLATALILFAAIGTIDTKEYKEREERRLAAEKDKENASARADFLRNMAHDILTPISGIQGMTNIARDNLQNVDTVNRCLSNISESSDHLLALVNNVLDVTHLVSDKKVEFKNEPFNIFDVLTSLSGIIQGSLESTTISFRTDFKGVVHPQVKGDPGQLKRVLLNFLDNGVKMTPSGQTLSFVCKEETAPNGDGKYTFLVHTTGDAFSSGLIATLNGLSTSGTIQSEAGSELALRLSRDLFREMGGHLSAENFSSGGSEVTLSLVLPYSSKEGGAGNKVYTPNLLNKRVLLVEDNAINQQIATYLLKPTQCDIALAKNGEEAVEKFLASREGTYSIILMDLSMPIMDGYEATKRIRSSGRKDALSTPILAMTANAFKEDTAKILESGMNEHLTKPIDKNMLYIALDKYKEGIPEKSEPKAVFKIQK